MVDAALPTQDPDRNAPSRKARSLWNKRRWLALLLVLLVVLLASRWRSNVELPFITLASTTSTENSGLFDHLLPLFTAKTGIQVRVVAVGTGAALRLGESGDADVVLVHDRAAEERFVQAGHGVKRLDVMYNDFVVVGPGNDPASIRGIPRAADALSRLASSKQSFVSRGDESGTHDAERRLWHAAGVNPEASSGQWYLEAGSGMGATLNLAASKNAYCLTDRGTWLSFANRREMEILVEGDPALFNPYGVIMVHPGRHGHVKERQATAFIEWLVGPEGQSAIASYTKEGQPLFKVWNSEEQLSILGGRSF
jgi:tungstate transport system substrate-binding protein